MRDYLNGILNLIGAESLTDEEFDSITLEDQNNNLEVYNLLLNILLARESVSSLTSRLLFYFKALGTDVPEPVLAQSKIFVGAPL